MFKVKYLKKYITKYYLICVYVYELCGLLKMIPLILTIYMWFIFCKSINGKKMHWQ